MGGIFACCLAGAHEYSRNCEPAVKLTNFHVNQKFKNLKLIFFLHTDGPCMKDMPHTSFCYVCPSPGTSMSSTYIHDYTPISHLQEIMIKVENTGRVIG